MTTSTEAIAQSFEQYHTQLYRDDKYEPVASLARNFLGKVLLPHIDQETLEGLNASISQEEITYTIKKSDE